MYDKESKIGKFIKKIKKNQIIFLILSYSEILIIYNENVDGRCRL